MSDMNVSNGLNKCCEGIKDFAYSAASCVGKSAKAIGSCFTATMAKLAEFLKPYFQKLSTFAQNNRQSLVVAIIACCSGAAIAALFSRCCKKNQPLTNLPLNTQRV